MSNKIYNYGAAIIKAKELYENSSYSITEIARGSVEFLGVEVNINTLKKECAEGNWKKIGVQFDSPEILQKMERIIGDRVDNPDSLSNRELVDLVMALDKLSKMRQTIKVTSGSGNVRLQGRTSSLEETS